MAFSLPIPPDTAIITDDECNTGAGGAALVNTLTGEIIGYTGYGNFACGSESGTVMLDGTIGTPNNTTGAGEGIFSIYDRDLNLIVDAVIGNPGIENVFCTGTTSDRTTYFYVISADDSDNLTVHKVDKTGATLQSWALGFTDSGDPVACSVTRDNTFFYFKIFSGGVQRIKRLNLGTSAVDEIGTISSSTSFIGNDTSGNFYLFRTVSSLPTIEKYDSSFNLLLSVQAAPTGYTRDFAHFSSDDLHLFAWTQKSSGISHPSTLSNFRKIKLSDLSVISDIGDIPTEIDSNFITPGIEISNSCPLLISSGPSISEGRDDCPGGALVGGGGPDGGGGGDAWCRNCVPENTPPPSGPAWFVSDLLSVGINNCWDITFIYAVEPLFNARGYTGQVNSAGALRGRFYAGFPTPDFSRYFDTNSPECGWLFSGHGI